MLYFYESPAWMLAAVDLVPLLLALVQQTQACLRQADIPEDLGGRAPRLPRDLQGSREKLLRKNWTHIRIEYFYVGDGYANLTEKEKEDVSELTTSVMKYYEDLLMVRSSGNIQLQSTCLELTKAAGKCSKGCEQKPPVVGNVIGPSGLNIYTRCNCKGQPNCGQGEGYLHADMLLLITVEDDTSCADKDTLAYATTSSRDPVTKRPTTGLVNICRSRFLAREPTDDVLWIATMKHEFAHSMVFSSSNFALFVDKDLQLLVKEMMFVLMLLMDTKSFERPVEVLKGVTKVVARTDWDTKSGPMVHHVLIVETPKVKEFVQKHFNCPQLDGAELELQGGSGTAFAHWEKRLFEYEAMAGVSTTFYAFTGLTLALFEDSGWYKVNFSMAEPLLFGAGLGCEFATKSCKAYAANHPKNPYPYCAKTHDYRCSGDRTTKMSCAIGNQTTATLPQYTYGPSTGKIALGDYCPLYMKYSEPFGGEPRQSVCTDSRNLPPEPFNHALQIFSTSSRCYDLATQVVQQNEKGSTTYGTQIGCFETRCKDGYVELKPQWSSFFRCYSKGQKIFIDKCKPDSDPGRKIGDRRALNAQATTSIAVPIAVLMASCF